MDLLVVCGLGRLFLTISLPLPFCRLWPYPPFHPTIRTNRIALVMAILCRSICRMRPAKLPDLFRLRDHFRKVGCRSSPGSIPPSPGYRSSPGPKASMPLIALTAQDSCAWFYLAGHLSSAVHPTTGPLPQPWALVLRRQGIQACPALRAPSSTRAFHRARNPTGENDRKEYRKRKPRPCLSP